MGLREWDNLRPNLFNLFINDLPKMFDNSCQPVTLNTSKLNCLMYTIKLDKLHTYVQQKGNNL
jgi:hypothetical protein